MPNLWNQHQITSITLVRRTVQRYIEGYGGDRSHFISSPLCKLVFMVLNEHQNNVAMNSRLTGCCEIHILKRPYSAFGGFPSSVVCYIVLCACKWSAKAKGCYTPNWHQRTPKNVDSRLLRLGHVSHWNTPQRLQPTAKLHVRTAHAHNR